jgi:hypothetical protein
MWIALADQNVFSTTLGRVLVMISIPTRYTLGLLLVRAIRREPAQQPATARREPSRRPSPTRTPRRRSCRDMFSVRIDAGVRRPAAGAVRRDDVQR